MDVIRILKGQTVAHTVLTSVGDYIRAATSVHRQMGGVSEIGEFTSLEDAEANAIDLATRYGAEALYIEDRT